MDFGCEQVRCISVKERSDKRKYVSKLLGDLKIPFEFFIVRKDKENTARGCMTSHITVIKEAYDKGVQRLMVFEDDIRFGDNISKNHIKTIRKFLDNENWDLFFLGGTPNIWNKNIYPVKNYYSIYKGHFSAAHAYIINRSYMEKIKNIVWDGKEYYTVDNDIFMQNDNSYISFPRMFFQRTIKNDRNLPVIITKMIGIGDKIVEWYALYINLQIKNILTVIVLIIIIFIIYKLIKNNQ